MNPPEPHLSLQPAFDQGASAFGRFAADQLVPRGDALGNPIAGFCDDLRRRTVDWADLPVPAGPLVPPSDRAQVTGLWRTPSAVAWRLARNILLHAVAPQLGEAGMRSQSYVRPEMTVAVLEWLRRHPELGRAAERLEEDLSREAAARTGRPWNEVQVRAALPFFVLIGMPPKPGGHGAEVQLLEAFLVNAQKEKAKRLVGSTQLASVFADRLVGTPGIEQLGDSHRVDSWQMQAAGEVIKRPGGLGALLAMLYLNLVHAHLGLLWPPPAYKLDYRRHVVAFIHAKCQGVLQQVLLHDECRPALADMAGTLAVALADMKVRTEGRYAPDPWPEDLPLPFRCVGVEGISDLCGPARWVLGVYGVQEHESLVADTAQLARDTASHLTMTLRAPALGMLDVATSGSTTVSQFSWAQVLHLYLQRCKAALKTTDAREVQTQNADLTLANLRADRVQHYFSFLARCAPAVHQEVASGIRARTETWQGAARPAPRPSA